MLVHSFLIFVIVPTSFCISRVLSLRPSGDGDYIQGSTADNGNPFVAARQRLKQQQLQYERDKYKYYAHNNNEHKAYDLNNNNNNNIAYSTYMQQQQQQPLQNGLGIMTKASAKHEPAVDDDLPLKASLRGDYEVSNGESQHNAMSAQNEIVTGFHQSKLERRSAALPTDQSAMDYENEGELDLDLPYGIQNVRKRTARHKPDHNKSVTYQSLCPTKRLAIPLETSGYEYRPSHYIEVTCAHYTPAHSYEFIKNRICSEAGFSCIQLNRTIHLIRRNKASTDECWESEIRIVPSGCECMWPKHDNGDIAAYHEAQKRYGAYTNVQANADYEQGEGYRQIQPQQAELFGINGLHRNENADGVGFEAFEYN